MREQIAHHSARTGQRTQQHDVVPQQEASRHRVGHQAGLHPEDTPYLTGEWSGQPADDETEEEDYDDEWPARLPTSARRYQVSPEAVYQQGNQRLHVRYVDVPPRSSRHAQLSSQRERYSDNYEGAPPRASVRARRLHWFVWLGVVVCVMLFGWIALSQLGAWIQAKQDDLTYGQVRHFDVNAVVGHNDSPTNPSHFTAENNNGDIFVIELPGGDSSKARIFQITTIPGNDGNPPVRISFQDVNRDGKPDMIVQIGDPNAMVTVILLNNGQTFVSKL
jgi:hypothetical protein